MGTLKMQRKLPFILFQYATRHRPDRVIKVADTILSHLKHPEKALISIQADSDDVTLYNKKFISRLLPYIKKKRVVINFNEPKGKVAAFNTVHSNDSSFAWDFVIPVSDWVEFTDNELDVTIRAICDEYSDGVCLFPASNNNDKAQYYLPVIHRRLYNHRGHLFHPELRSKFYRDELCLEFSSYKFEEINLFKYSHPDLVGTNPDKLTITNLTHWKKDLQIIEKNYGSVPLC